MGYNHTEHISIDNARNETHGTSSDYLMCRLQRLAMGKNSIRIGTLLEQLQQRHSLVGHRRLRWVPGLATRTFTEDRR